MFSRNVTSRFDKRIIWCTPCVSDCFARLLCFSTIFIAIFWAPGAPMASKALASEALEWADGGMFANIVNPGLTAKPVASSKTKRKYRKLNTSRRKVKVASLGNSFDSKQWSNIKRGSVTGGSGGVIWHARSSCLNEKLKSAIYHIARNWGRVRVNSTCRSRKHNRRVGGANGSYRARKAATSAR